MDKQGIRKEICRKRDSFSLNEVILRSRRIKEFLFSYPNFKEAKKVLFYASFRNEVSTLEMIKEVLDEKSKRVFLPRIKNALLEICEISSFDGGLYSKKGILEPTSGLYDGQLDMAILPGIAFDKKGYRIGFGEGYYDRFLTGKKIDKVSLSFAFQIVGCIPNEKHDIPTDCIITEEEIIDCQNYRKNAS